VEPTEEPVDEPPDVVAPPDVFEPTEEDLEEEKVEKESAPPAVVMSGPALIQGFPTGTWATGVQIQNIGDQQGQVFLVYYDMDSIATYTSSVTSVDPGGSTTYYLDPVLPDGFRGSAVAYSDQPIRAVVNEENLSGFQAGSYNGFTEGTATVSYPLVKNEFFGATTNLVIQNVDDSDATLDIVFKATNGTEYPVNPDPTIGPNRSYLIEPSAASLPTGFLGSATVEVTGGKIVGMYNEFSGNAVLVGNGFAAGADATKLYAPLAKMNFFGADTGIMVQNVDSTTGTVYVEYTSTGGDKYKSDDWPKTLGPGASHSFYLPNESNLPATFLGSAIVTGTQGMVAIVNEETSSTKTVHAAFADGSGTVSISVPLVKRAFFGNSTGVMIQNVDSTTATVNVAYKRKSDGALYYSKDNPKSLGAGKSYSSYLPNETGVPSGFLGSAIVTGSLDIVGIVNEDSGTMDYYSTNAFNLSP
jgi:hypothetical protein